MKITNISVIFYPICKAPLRIRFCKIAVYYAQFERVCFIKE